MSVKELRGVIVPVITPITSEEEIDETAFRKILRRLIESGVHGIFVGGSAGEGPLLVDRQWRRMVEIASDEVREAIPLLGGAIDTSTRRVCDKIAVLKQAGYGHIVVTPTFYVTASTPSEHLRLYGRAKEIAGDAELVAYNIPQCTIGALAVETVCEMAQRGWVRYCKESSGDFAFCKNLIERGKEVGLTVLAGDELTSGDALLAGADGIVPVCANYDPATYLHLYEASRRGNRNDVDRLMVRVRLLHEILPLSGPCWLAGIKHALAVLGIGSGTPVSPLEPADSERIAKIDAQVKADRDANRTLTFPRQ